MAAKTKRNKDSRRWWVPAAVTVPVFMGCIAAAAAVYAAIGLKQAAVGTAASAAAGLGCFLSGLLSARIHRQRGLITGALIGAAVFTVFFAASLIAAGTVGLTALWRAVMFISAGALGGSIGIFKGDRAARRPTGKRVKR